MTRLLVVIAFLLTFPSFSQSEKVVLIGIDGLGSFGLKRAETPVMDSLMEHGAYSLKARAVYPTLSCPNWASMIKGVKPAKHRIKSNYWEKRLSAEDRNQYESCPSVFKVLMEQSPAKSVAGFVQWEGFVPLVEEELRPEFWHDPNADSVVHQAIHFILENKPDLSFIHLDLVDQAGHSFGVRSKEYKCAVEEADMLVGLLVNAVKQALPDEKIVFIISSDHGFTGKHHGGFSPKTRKIPFIVSGYNIRKNLKIKRRVRIIDAPEIIADIVQVPASEKWDGKAVKEIFEEK